MSITTNKDDFPLCVSRHSRTRKDRKYYIDSPEDGECRGVTSVQTDGQMFLLPPTKGRSVIYLFGASGSGKTTTLANYLHEWRKFNQRHQIYIVSRLSSDKAWNGLNVKYINVDDSLISDPITAHDLPTGSFIVFDDIDSIRPKKLQEAVYSMAEDMLFTGRHNDISVGFTSHIGAAAAKTKPILTECHIIVCFPHGSSAYQIKYVLTNYGNMSAKQVEQLLELPSRWVGVKTSFPPAVVYSHGAYMLCKSSQANSSRSSRSSPPPQQPVLDQA
jgi:GTPase SAR1 family protein